MAKLPYGIEKIEALQYEEELFTYVEALQAREGLSIRQVVPIIMGKYRIRSWLRPVLLHYLQTKTIDASLALEPVGIERESVYGGARLILPHDITQPILKDYITKNWTSKIKPVVNPVANERHTIRQFPDRDQKIYADYQKGTSVTSIAFKYSISESTVKRIIKFKKEA